MIILNIISTRMMMTSAFTSTAKGTISNVMRLVAGNLGIVASFGLVVYAPDVIDLLLNFTAIEFVATLDNSCFELASKGFLGISIEKKAKQVESFKYEYKIRRKSIFVRFFVYLFYFLLYTGAFFAIVALQTTRQSTYNIYRYMFIFVTFLSNYC